MTDSISKRLIDAAQQWAFACFKTHTCEKETFAELEVSKEAFKQLAQEVEEKILYLQHRFDTKEDMVDAFAYSLQRSRESLWRELDRTYRSCNREQSRNPELFKIKAESLHVLRTELGLDNE